MNKQYPFTETMKYTPVDCSTYAHYEQAILQGSALRIYWRGTKQQCHIEKLWPNNLKTRWHSEYLLGHNQLGQYRVIRLDRIIESKVLTP